MRCSFEHAVEAHWCYFVEGGIERLAVDVNRKFRRHYLQMSHYLDNEELRGEAEALRERTGKGLPKFTEMMTNLDSGDFLRTSYANLSLSVHPTHLTVSAYLASDNSTTSLRHEAEVKVSYPTL